MNAGNEACNGLFQSHTDCSSDRCVPRLSCKSPGTCLEPNTTSLPLCNEKPWLDATAFCPLARLKQVQNGLQYYGLTASQVT